MAEDFIYRGDGNTAFVAIKLATYVDAFADGLGIERLNVNDDSLLDVAGALATAPASFPHAAGWNQASPFKKAAYFFVWFVSQKPIIDALPSSLFSDKFRGIENHQNACFAFFHAVDALEGASLTKDSNQVVVLENRIHVSKHWFMDFVEAFSGAVPVYHFKIVSLLFEQLAYKVNPDASYPEDL
jgi:hypothetical protein